MVNKYFRDTYLFRCLNSVHRNICSVMSDSLRPHGVHPPGSSVHGDYPGKNTRVDCHALLQGTFPGMEPRSPALQEDPLPTEPPGEPLDILEFLK